MKGLEAEQVRVLSIAALPFGQRPNRLPSAAEYSAGEQLIERALCTLIVCPCGCRGQRIVATPLGREALRIALLVRSFEQATAP